MPLTNSLYFLFKFSGSSLVMFFLIKNMDMYTFQKKKILKKGKKKVIEIWRNNFLSELFS